MHVTIFFCATVHVPVVDIILLHVYVVHVCVASCGLMALDILVMLMLYFAATDDRSLMYAEYAYAL